MKNQQKRGLLASLGAMIAVGALALGGAAASAAPLPMPSKSGVVITKLEQPATAGDAADGTPIGTLPSDPIPGVTFEAYPVTVAGTPGTNAWQQNVAATTLAYAQANHGAAVRTGTTDSNGQIFWQDGVLDAEGVDAGDDLPRGLYLVRETSTPAGVVAAGDFLLAVPLTDPEDLNAWLDDIYVYPKNSTVDATKTVQNAADLKVGDTVTWTIDTAIPDVRDGDGDITATDAFEIRDTLQNDELALNETAPATGITVTAPAGLTKGVQAGPQEDYYVVSTSASGATTYRIVFTADGRQALADALAADAGARVTVTLDTTVLKADVIDNAASIYPNQQAITDSKPITTTPVEVKYGSYLLNKTSSNASVTGADLAGAQFKVYSNKEDADASNGNNLTPSTNPSGVWTTTSGGTVSISGLRYSNFADGVPQVKWLGEDCESATEGGPNCTRNAKYQTYWLVEVTALDGHQLLSEPIEFTVDGVTNGSAAQTSQKVVNQENRNGFVLPLTGGMGTAILTIGGIALLAVVLIVARRRRAAEAAE